MVLLLALTGCGLQTTGDSKAQQNQTQIVESSGTELSSIPAVHEVVISGGMDPQEVTVAVGDVVVWRVADGKDHMLLGDMVDSGDELTTGNFYQVTLDETGTFAYHDVLQGGDGLIHVVS